MSSNRQTIKSDLARARSSGSAREGVHHWINQRVTAIASLFLMLWLLYSVININSFSYEDFTAWLAMPVNAILMILAIISVFYHAALGAQVIVEDYFHNEALKVAKLVAMKLFFFAATIACIFSILKIALA